MYVYTSRHFFIFRMISEGSCDTEDWSDDAANSALHHMNALHFKMFSYFTILLFYSIFDQALENMRLLSKTFKKILQAVNFCMVAYMMLHKGEVFPCNITYLSNSALII